nr:glycosyltransferase 87 family protein [Phytoactinopolyspora alkaliphila]
MAVSALVAVVATARTVPRRPWDGLLVAASPVLLLSATINWDLLAVAATSVAILAWTRERPGWAGVLIGVGAAAKLYPVLLLGAMLLVVMRAPDRRTAFRGFGRTTAGTAAAWVALNAPVAALSWDGWAAFFRFNAERGADFGSAWYAIGILAPDLLRDDIDRLVVGAGLIMLGLIVVLAMVAPEPPRLAQLAFLAVAAFLLVNKVWSPQYTLWLLPLAVLARPRWRELLVWQVAEVAYFISIWFYLAGFFDPEHPMISSEVYAWSVLLRVAALLWLCGVVIRDILRPENDPVRPYAEMESHDHSRGAKGAIPA